MDDHDELMPKNDSQDDAFCKDFDSASSILNFDVEPYDKGTKEVERKSSQGKEIMQKEVISNERDLDMLVRNATFVDERARQLLLSRKSLIKRLFPSEEDRILEKWRGRMISSAADFNIDLYNMATEARLTAMKEKYDAGLMLLKAEYRQRIGSFMLNKMDELKQDVNACQFKFVDDITLKYRKAESVRHLPTLYKHFIETILSEEERYFNFLERIISRFESVVDEQLKSYGK